MSGTAHSRARNYGYAVVVVAESRASAPSPSGGAEAIDPPRAPKIFAYRLQLAKLWNKAACPHGKQLAKPCQTTKQQIFRAECSGGAPPFARKTHYFPLPARESVPEGAPLSIPHIEIKEQYSHIISFYFSIAHNRCHGPSPATKPPTVATLFPSTLFPDTRLATD